MKKSRPCWLGFLVCLSHNTPTIAARIEEITRRPGLVSPAEWRILDSMQDLFACRECHAIYAISRRLEPPVLPPLCRVCGTKFPPCELGEWLVYHRAEPELNVDEWLRSPPKVPENVSQADDPASKSDRAAAESETKSAEVTAEATPPSDRLRKLAALAARA